ncbi:MAG TPA: cytochrome b/b6 domain-containing protein, partial [Beutenbergiaceae bacterium]|nr:cytochrome b/b6 domain-containing protein [Beutenbergiaceae bacterium]
SGPARRGLPRVEGGDPWPPEGTVVSGAFQAHPAQAQPAQAPASEAPAPAAPAQPVEASPTPAQEPAAAPAQAAPAQPAPAQATPAQTAPAQATPARPAPTPAAAKTPAQPAKPAAATSGAAASEAKRYGPFTMKQWVGAGAVIALAIVGLVALVVMAARWFAGLDFMQSFLATYPGEYDLPDSAPIGFPGWLGWQHFFNIFLMILIIRSGLLVRTQERPPAYWTSKRKPKKISIQLWLHQSLNLLWIINGLIFVILLFATGHWMRVIPTSPEVFPNAASALLQYLTLDWPTDNGWVNYNSLQQIAYFLTIFIAAPLSAITGYRMSEAWPEKSKLGTKFSIEGARKLHFPLMIYFIGFIVVHVALVFSTGALRNLNHMFAAQGSADPSVYANNWTGFWLFVASVVVVVIGWIAARPMIMAPIARIFGNVSAR